MRHRQCRLTAEAAFGPGRSVADGDKGALNGVLCRDVSPDPMTAFNVNWTG